MRFSNFAIAALCLGFIGCAQEGPQEGSPLVQESIVDDIVNEINDAGQVTGLRITVEGNENLYRLENAVNQTGNSRLIIAAQNDLDADDSETDDLEERNFRVIEIHDHCSEYQEVKGEIHTISAEKMAEIQGLVEDAALTGMSSELSFTPDQESIKFTVVSNVYNSSDTWDNLPLTCDDAVAAAEAADLREQTPPAYTE